MSIKNTELRFQPKGHKVLIKDGNNHDYEAKIKLSTGVFGGKQYV